MLFLMLRTLAVSASVSSFKKYGKLTRRQSCARGLNRYSFNWSPKREDLASIAFERRGHSNSCCPVAFKLVGS